MTTDRFAQPGLNEPSEDADALAEQAEENLDLEYVLIVRPKYGDSIYEESFSSLSSLEENLSKADKAHDEAIEKEINSMDREED